MEKPDPGSSEAIGRGCTCDVGDNNHGLGQNHGGQTYFFPDLDCPLHGVDAVTADAVMEQ
jgi:hypothetical protein